MDKFTGYFKPRQIHSQWKIMIIRLMGIFMQIN